MKWIVVFVGRDFSPFLGVFVFGALTPTVYGGSFRHNGGIFAPSPAELPARGSFRTVTGRNDGSDGQRVVAETAEHIRLLWQ